MHLYQIIQKVILFLLFITTFTLLSFKAAMEVFSYDQKIDMKNLKHLKADLKFNAGTFHLSTHSQPQASLNATYTNDKWQPDFNFDRQSNRLIIHQPSEKNFNMKDEDKNDWKVKLPDNLNTDLKLRIGAGEATMDFEGSKLNDLDVKTGAGKFDINLANTSLSKFQVSSGVGAVSIDLSGSQDKNLEGTIDGGIGEIKLVLPEKVGVRIKVNGLLSVEKNNLKKKDGYYVNDLYGKTSTQINMNVSGGLGSLILQ